MITVAEATRIVLDHCIELDTHRVPLGEALGRYLREDLVADRDFPPYDRVTMDGIAIHFDAFSEGRREFPVEGVGAAGAPQATLRDPQHCLEIMTGAILPENTDTVVRYEDVEIKEGIARITIDEVNRGQNIHRQGIDRKKGQVVAPAGRFLSAAELGVAATIGKAEIEVSRPPSVVVVSSGDELVEIDQTPLSHQIRRSNVHRLCATLSAWGIPADTAHLVDDREVIVEKLAVMLEQYRVIIMSGGVSKGKFDYFPGALAELGVEKLFHRIRQRPGKPFWFGKAPNGALVFALPGNPVSSFMCTHRYFYPWWLASLGLPLDNQPQATLAADVPFKSDLTYFCQVKLEYTSDGRTLAHPIEGHGSGDLANLVDTDAFVELPRGKEVYRRGEAYRIISFR